MQAHCRGRCRTKLLKSRIMDYQIQTIQEHQERLRRNVKLHADLADRDAKSVRNHLAKYNDLIRRIILHKQELCPRKKNMK